MGHRRALEDHETLNYNVLSGDLLRILFEYLRVIQLSFFPVYSIEDFTEEGNLADDFRLAM